MEAGWKLIQLISLPEAVLGQGAVNYEVLGGWTFWVEKVYSVQCTLYSVQYTVK